MKSMSTAMQTYIAQNTVTLTTLVLIQRVDGVVLAFTSWDVPIFYNSVSYLPAIAMSPSGVKTNADLTSDQMDIIGAIDSVYITEVDIDGGRFDNAKVTIMKVNPNDLTMGQITELTGIIGQINYGENNFQAAVNSLGNTLNQQIGDVVTPTCRVRQLGDFQCKVTIASYQIQTTIASIVDQKTLTFSSTKATGYYDYGMVRFASKASGGGLNYSINAEVKTSTGTGTVMTVVLQEFLPFLAVVGNAVTLEAGCDRRSITCRNKFNNLVNIHSEPYVPGNNYLLITGRPPTS